MAKLLVDLSGFEFEDLMEDVVRNMGCVADRTVSTYRGWSGT